MTENIEQLEDMINKLGGFLPTTKRLAALIGADQDAVETVLRRGRQEGLKQAPTASQRAVIVALRNLIIKHRRPPTLRELSAAVGRSPTAVHSSVSILIRKGLLERPEGGGLRITEQGEDYFRVRRGGAQI